MAVTLKVERLDCARLMIPVKCPNHTFEMCAWFGGVWERYRRKQTRKLNFIIFFFFFTNTTRYSEDLNRRLFSLCKTLIVENILPLLCRAFF